MLNPTSSVIFSIDLEEDKKIMNRLTCKFKSDSITGDCIAKVSDYKPKESVSCNLPWAENMGVTFKPLNGSNYARVEVSLYYTNTVRVAHF